MSGTPLPEESTGSKSVEPLAGKTTVQPVLKTWLDPADQAELVDMSPHALQRRMMHGNVYPDSRKAELAPLRVANLVDEELLPRCSRGQAPETRERVLVCVSRPGISEDLIRRGCRLAQRAGGELLVVHVRTEDEPVDADWLREIERLTNGGTFAAVDAESAVDGGLSFAFELRVTQIVAGEPLRTRWQELVRGSFVHKLIRKASNLDIHVIARR